MGARGPPSGSGVAQALKEAEDRAETRVREELAGAHREVSRIARVGEVRVPEDQSMRF